MYNTNYNDLLKEYEKMIYKITNIAAATYNVDYYKDDLIQIGRIALWKAQNDFNESRNTKFSSFAFSYIKNDIFHESRKIANQETISLDNLEYNDDLLIKEGFEQGLIDKYELEEIYDYIDMLSETESTITKQVLAGNSTKQISKTLDFSKQYINRVIKSSGVKLNQMCFA